MSHRHFDPLARLHHLTQALDALSYLMATCDDVGCVGKDGLSAIMSMLAEESEHASEELAEVLQKKGVPV